LGHNPIWLKSTRAMHIDFAGKSLLPQSRCTDLSAVKICFRDMGTESTSWSCD